MQKNLPPDLNQTSDRLIDWKKPLFPATAFFLVIALLFGGGGTYFPISEMLVQLSALPALFIALFLKNSAETKPPPITIILLMAGCVILALAQLLPLPAFLWHILPGREELVEVAVLLGQENSWRSWSIDSQLTLQSGLSLTIAISMILAATQLSTAERKKLLWLFMILAGVNLLIAILQTLSGGNNFYPYATAHKGLPLGLFANRNHMAELMLLAVIGASALLNTQTFAADRSFDTDGTQKKAWDNDSRWKLRPYYLCGLIALGLFGIVSTNSRAVSALIIPVLFLIIFLSIPDRYKKLSWIGGAIAGIVVVLISAIFYWGAPGGVAGNLLNRFSQSEDHRFEFWPDTIATLWAYFPFGSGLGTFDIAFRAHEKLETLGPNFVNRAHNEYIEVAIETGIFGVGLILIFLAWLTSKLIKIWPNRRLNLDNWLALHAAVALIALTVHSMVDYPLRSLSIMTTAALFIAILAGQGTNGKRQT